MPTERPRIQVTLDEQTNTMLASVAAQNDRSLSATASDLIREALELHEDKSLSAHADARLKKTRRWVSHDDAWS